VTDLLKTRDTKWLGLGLIILATTVPFLGKAFHIDDPLYLAVARQILVNPWDPFGAEVLWEKAPESLFDADFNPPLWSYCLAGVMALTGEPEAHVESAGTSEQGTPLFKAASSRWPEVAMHLLESLFSGAAIIALYLLSQRWVRWPLTATALVALSPAMLPGQNVMLEGPVMAFWLWGVWFHLRAIETGRMKWVWASGTLVALAVMTKYTCGLVVLLLAAISIWRRHWRSLWFLVPPVLALGLWSLHNLAVYDRLHVLVILGRAQTGERQGSGIDLYESWGRLLAMFRAIGAVTALAIPVLAVVMRKSGAWIALLLVTTSLAVGWVGQCDMVKRLDDRGQALDESGRAITLLAWFAKFGGSAHAVGFGALGFVVLGGLGITSWSVRLVGPSPPTPFPATGARGERFEKGLRQDNEILLWVWLGAVLAFGVFAVPFLAVRHLLPGVPPLVWLTLRRLEELWATSRSVIPRIILAATAIATTACGFLVAKADYDFAAWYRHVAMNVAARTVAAGLTLDREVWFTGHWGWAYYSQRVSMKPFLPEQAQLNDGDFLLLPLIQTWDPIPKDLHPHLRRLHIITPQPQITSPIRSRLIRDSLDVGLNSVRTISTEVHYYSGGTLNLPWRFSRKPLDDFVVYEFVQNPTGSTTP